MEKQWIDKYRDDLNEQFNKKKCNMEKIGWWVFLCCCIVYPTTAWQISLGGNPFFELLELLIGIDCNYGDPSFAIKVTF